MTSLAIVPPYPVFSASDGTPVDDGFVYIGTASLNPETNPISAYWDAALTIPATQPIRTLAGYPSRSGTPSNIYVDATDYSVTLRDKNGTLVFNSPNADQRGGLSSNSIQYTLGDVNSIIRTVQGRLRDFTSVLDFGAVRGGVTNCTTAFANYLAFCKASGFPFIIPEGNYLLTSGAINFIAAGLTIKGLGKAKLTYTGAGPGFVLDAKAIGGPGANFGGMTIENLIIVGNASTTEAWYSSGLVRSTVKNVEARNATLYGFNILFSVSTHFDCIKYSGNEGGVQSPKPSYGIHLGNDGAGFYVADCTFTDLIAEDTAAGVGMFLEDAKGNIFNGGTAEGCTKGLTIGTASRRNTFNNFWMEANSSSDAEVDGVATLFNNCNFGSNSPTLLNLQIALGQQTTVMGGYLRAAELGAGSLDTSFIDVGFDQNLSGLLGIQGTGTYKTFGCLKIDNAGLVVGQMNDVFGPVSGIKFAATQVASSDVNTLDDYEEGSFTVGLTPVTSGTITLDASFNTLSYVKIGKQVTVTGNIRVSSVAAPVGDLNITGLTFTSNAGVSGRAAAAVFAHGLAATATTTIMGIIAAADNKINLLKYSAGSIANLAGDVQAGSQFYVTVTYFV